MNKLTMIIECSATVWNIKKAVIAINLLKGGVDEITF